MFYKVLGQNNLLNINILLENIMKNGLNESDELEIVSPNINLLDKIDIQEVENSYSDNVIYFLNNNLNLSDTRVSYRFFENTKILERKINVCKFEIGNLDNSFIKFSKEKQLYLPDLNINDYTNYKIMRRQRIEYRFKDENLRNWKIEKTIRFYYEDPNSKKNNMKLDKNNIYNNNFFDEIDIGIEYIHNEENNIKQDFNILINRLCPQVYYKLHNIYHILSNTYKINLDLYENNICINTKSINYKETSFFEIDSVQFSVVIIIYHDKTLYEFIKNDTIKTLLIIDEIDNIKNDFVIFKALKKNDIYYLFDIDNEIIKYASKYMNFVNLNKLHFKHLNDILEYSELNNKMILYEDDYHVYKFESKPILEFIFMAKWIPCENLYYLYLEGSNDDIIRDNPILNKYSVSHFNYHPLTQTEQNYYILFDNPFNENLSIFDDKKYNDGSLHNCHIKLLLNETNLTWEFVKIDNDSKISNYKLTLISIHNALCYKYKQELISDSKLNSFIQYLIEINSNNINTSLIHSNNTDVLVQLCKFTNNYNFIILNNNYRVFKSFIEIVLNLHDNMNNNSILVSSKINQYSNKNLICVDTNSSNIQESLHKFTFYKPNMIQLIISDKIHEYIDSYSNLINYIRLIKSLLRENGKCFILIDNNGTENHEEPNHEQILYKVIGNNYELVSKKNNYDFECVINRKHYYIRLNNTIEQEEKEFYINKFKNISELKKEFITINGKNKLLNSHIDLIKQYFNTEIIKLSKVKELQNYYKKEEMKNIYALILTN